MQTKRFCATKIKSEACWKLKWCVYKLQTSIRRLSRWLNLLRANWICSDISCLTIWNLCFHHCLTSQQYYSSARFVKYFISKSSHNCRKMLRVEKSTSSFTRNYVFNKANWNCGKDLVYLNERSTFSVVWNVFNCNVLFKQLCHSTFCYRNTFAILIN